MGSMTVFQNAKLPTAFTAKPIPGMGDLTEGVSAGFPVVSFKGKVWKVKVRGEEHLWCDDRGQPVPYVDAVIVNGSSHVSKQFYAKKFADGEEAGAPDCWSLTGVRPDKSVAEPVNPTCANCPKNQWGSRISESGKQAKACQDNRRLAVVPYSTLLSKNEEWGGPMLLRIPPTSLNELAGFQKKMKAIGFPYYAVAVRIHFDLNKAFPMLLFTPLQPLTEDEAEAVIAMATAEATQRMLNEAVDYDAQPEAEPEAKAADVFLNANAGAKPVLDYEALAGKATAVVTPAPVAPVKVEQAPVTPPPAANNDENPMVAQLRQLVGAGVMTKEQFKLATGVDFDPPAPPVAEIAPWVAKPEHAALAQLVEAGSLDRAVFLQVAGYEYGGPLPAAKEAAPAPVKETKAKVSKPKATKAEDVVDATFTEKPALDAALDSILG